MSIITRVPMYIQPSVREVPAAGGGAAADPVVDLAGVNFIFG